MGENNPDRLILILEELIDHLKKWNYYTSEALKESDELIATTYDNVEKSKLNVSLSENHVAEDLSKINKKEGEVNLVKSKVEHEKIIVGRLLSTSKSNLDLAASNLEFWESEFQKATNWLSDATNRLDLASENLSSAQIGFENAKTELEDAKEALYGCEHSNERSLCLMEHAAVKAAQLSYGFALIRLKKAKLELQLAKKDFNKATACFDLCTNARNLSEQSLFNAQSAINSANEAGTLIENGLQKTLEADNSCKNAFELNNFQTELVTENKTILNNQITLQTEVERIQSENQNLSYSLQNLVFGAIKELEVRIEYLRKFAQATTEPKYVSHDSNMMKLLKNPATIAGSLLIASLIFGPNAFLLTSGALMSILAFGPSKKHNNQNFNLNESGVFDRTGRKIEQILSDNWKIKEKVENKNEVTEEKKSLDDKIITKLPLRTPDEQKKILEYQRLNHPSNIYSFNHKIFKKEPNQFIPNKRIEPPINYLNYDYFKQYKHYSSLHEKIKDTAKDIFIRKGPFEMHYDPLGKAIDEAVDKEYHGHWELSPCEKDKMKKEMQFEQYQHPSYFLQSMQVSMNNNYDSVRPLY